MTNNNPTDDRSTLSILTPVALRSTSCAFPRTLGKRRIRSNSSSSSLACTLTYFSNKHFGMSELGNFKRGNQHGEIIERRINRRVSRAFPRLHRLCLLRKAMLCLQKKILTMILLVSFSEPESHENPILFERLIPFPHLSYIAEEITLQYFLKRRKTLLVTRNGLIS